MDSSAWLSGEPDGDDWVARLQEKNGKTVLSGTGTYKSPRYYVCQQYTAGESAP